MPVGASLGAAAIGGATSLIGANTQAKATDKASKQQMQMYEQTRADLAPYRTAGAAGTNQLMAALPDLTKPIVMDQATLAKTPGYQFNLAQGLKATQSGAAARGLGTSGAALKGAAGYATGLADSTYQNQFNNAVTNQTNAYNRLMGVSQLGQNAAAQTGAYGTQTAANVGANTIAGGTAQAAGLIGAGNAFQTGANNYLGYNLGQQYLAQNGSMYTPRNPLLGYGSGTY